MEASGTAAVGSWGDGGGGERVAVVHGARGVESRFLISRDVAIQRVGDDVSGGWGESDAMG